MLCHTLRLTAGSLSSGRGLPEFSVPITSESADCACAGSPLTMRFASGRAASGLAGSASCGRMPMYSA